jgi:hypothetical protein
MTRAARIVKANRASELATKRADLATRKAYIASSYLKWAAVCSPSAETLERALDLAIGANRRAIAALEKKQAASEAIAAAWEAESTEPEKTTKGSKHVS